MTESTDPNSRDGLVQRARDMAIALKESPTRSLARIHHDEAIALDVARATLQQEYSYALDVLQAEEYATATPPPEDDGVFELPTDRDYDVRVLLHKVRHRAKGEVYIVGAPMGGEFQGPDDNPHAALPIKFSSHQSRVVKGNDWASRSAAGNLIAQGITVHVECRKGVFSVSKVE
ncbi:MAG: hypothetical protein IPO08_20545 [Xanthomonadales bacterium]|nr:hypothetical protein [Xanthomonadales bacterium]